VLWVFQDHFIGAMDGSMDAEWKAHPKGKSGSDLML
jgi:hypothetical protein